MAITTQSRKKLKPVEFAPTILKYGQMSKEEVVKAENKRKEASAKAKAYMEELLEKGEPEVTNDEDVIGSLELELANKAEEASKAELNAQNAEDTERATKLKREVAVLKRKITMLKKGS